MKSFARGILILAFIAILSAPSPRAQDVAPLAPPQQSAPTPAANPTCEITGLARSGKTPLPGATVTAANSLTGKKITTATTLDGKFSLSGIPRGRYVVRVEFMGFAVFTKEVVLNPETPSANVDVELILASRQQEQSNNNNASIAAAGRGFQSLAVDSALSSLAGGTSGFGGASASSGGQGSDLSSLPLNGAGVEGPSESVSISGAQGRTQDFGGGSPEELQDRIQEFRERAQREGGGGFGGGQGFGGPGGGTLAIGRMGRGFNINQPHGVLYFSDDNSGLDARPFSLSGLSSAKESYNQLRFGANVGGPLNIPKIFSGGNKWFFFLGWNGSRGSTPYDAFSTVPTIPERGGDFRGATYNDGTPVALINPQTGQSYQFNGVSNVLDPTLISSSSAYLLKFIPLPNIPPNARGQNFHYITTGDSNSDTAIVRLIHNFGYASGPGAGPFGGGGGGGGGGGRRRSQNSINFGLNWSRSSNTIVNPFPSLNGGTSTQGLNATTGWTYGKGRATNILRFNYNHNHVSTTNLYSNVEDVAGPGGAGIGGISNDPFDWGLPGISFTSFGGLNDPMTRRELDQTYTLSDTVSWNRGKHNLRFGGDYRRILQSFRASRNAEGSFVFTGFATSAYDSSGNVLRDTGLDFADFLLGFPQQTSLQFGASSYNFRANAYDFFIQDDWRFRPNLSLNLGLRYEYNGPYTEAGDRISNLAVSPGFTSAQPVVPVGAPVPPGSGPFLFSSIQSLVKPDRNNFAPRVGLAWKPQKQTVVRVGYGINHNLAQYGTVIQNFAFQPPFAEAATNATNVSGLIGGNPLTLANGFPTAAPSTVTNNFAIDPNYRLGYVQIWNLDIQREFPYGIMLNVGYNGAKGTRLDTERALVPTGNQPFIYESSEGNSSLNAASVRLRKRMAKGLGLGAQYVFSKSLDDAASIGGGAVVVAQNPFDISNDRGLSSFDQTQRFTGNWIYDLPFGENRRFAQKGAASHILGGWQWSGDFTIASGMYFTPRVLGSGVDISRGVSGSLRANLIGGQSITVSIPSTREWFNTAAFCNPNVNCPPGSPTQYGDAGRNIIEGPGQVTFDMTINRTITIKESRTLDLHLTANNVFNNVHFTSINTVVNSSTFGEITAAGSMRRVTMQARFRF
ncbi:MAG TPA: TonB-dependent receptor [Candidatus Acidoferrum sp.]